MKTTALSLALASAALFVGCTSTAPPAAKIEHVSHAAYPRVVAQDGMDDILAAGEEVVTKSESGALNVTVPVRVLSPKDVRSQYRFTFLDERNRPLRPETDWQYKLLPAKSQVFLEATALDPQAVDWRLEVRPNRD